MKSPESSPQLNEEQLIAEKIKRLDEALKWVNSARISLAVKDPNLGNPQTSEVVVNVLMEYRMHLVINQLRAALLSSTSTS